MRHDMAKVLIEAERTQSNARSRKWGKKIAFVPDSDYEHEIVGKISSARRRQYGYDHKESTDVLRPLRGYLHSKVGQPWDQVYSELCANLDKRKTTGAHVFTHLWQYVEKDCWIGAKTGNIYSNRGSRYGLGTTHKDYYVHPWTGILLEVPEVVHEKKKYIPSTFIELSIDTCHVWIKGVWYFANWTWVTVYKQKKGYGGRIWVRPEKERVFSNKRQLSKKELRDLKLSNTKLKLK